MVAASENLVLEHLKRIQAKLDSIGFDLTDLKVRQSTSEQHLAQQGVQFAALNARMDRFDERLGRIEKRLDLIDVIH